ncbi:hypothetical protein BDW71DRAFT_201910 [Aspergillus fruticulosus]
MLFGIKSEALVNFPGIESYCDYLEHDAFQPLMSPTFDLIWDLLSCANPKKGADCWDWGLAVLQVTQSEQPEISIHDIARHLEQQGGGSKKSLGQDQDKTYLYMAIFGVLCWASLVVRPRLIFTEGLVPSLTCILPQGFKSTKSSSAHRLSDRCMRPVLTTFRSFKLQHWGDQPDERAQGGSRETDCLYEASLNIYSLCYFGHVTIQWVDTISEHLRFSPAIAGCPCFAFRHSLTLHSIAEQLDPLSPEDRDQCCVSLEQEIILSYRLLFGQDGKSRKLAREEVRKLKNSYPNQSIDDMLLDLCERKYEYGSLWWKTYDKVLQGYPCEIWPITCRTLEGHLQQHDVYSARDDFPRLGLRLRNPLQWYTFWAVLLFGGVANILAALQLLVALVQLQASF